MKLVLTYLGHESYSQVIHRLDVRNDEAPIKYYLDTPKSYRVNTYLSSYSQEAVNNLCISV